MAGNANTDVIYAVFDIVFSYAVDCKVSSGNDNSEIEGKYSDWNSNLN